MESFREGAWASRSSSGITGVSLLTETHWALEPSLLPTVLSCAPLAALVSFNPLLLIFPFYAVQ